MSGHDGIGLDRRRLLGALAAGTALGVAGCLEDSDGTDGNGDGDGNGSDERSFDPNIDHPGGGPIEFTDAHSCVVCGMGPTDYPNHQSQLAHENGEGAVACSPGCFLAYYVATTADSPVAGAWTTEITSGELIDATEASFVLVTDEAAADDPMGIDPRVFAERDDALAFVDDWDAEELSEDDIVELEEIDREIAEIYRGSRL